MLISRKPKTYLALLFSALSTVACPAFALDKFAHQLVCQLAFTHLPQAKQQKINQLLTFIPTQHRHLINRYNHQKPHANITFAKACSWADAIKKLPEYQHMNSWHYLNVPRTTQTVTAAHCRKHCIISAITTHQQQLKQSPSSWSKTQALLFLGHWLGDIHQPLHISFASDRGGNKQVISSASKCKNLHWYWDECLLKSDRLSFAKQLKQLQQQWHSQLTKASINLIDTRTIAGWANESFQLTQQAEFGYCHLTKKGCRVINKPLAIKQAYQQQYLPLYKSQLVKAAKRLHYLLDDVL